MFWAVGKRRARPPHEQIRNTLDPLNRLYISPAKRRQRSNSTPRFEVEADCLCPVTDIEFAKQIA